MGFPVATSWFSSLKSALPDPHCPVLFWDLPPHPATAEKSFPLLHLSQGFSAQPLPCPRIPCSAHSTLLRCKTPRQDVLIKGVSLKCRITAAHSVFSGVMLQRDKGTPKKPPLWKSWGKVMRAVSEQALGGKLD